MYTSVGQWEVFQPECKNVRKVHLHIPWNFMTFITSIKDFTYFWGFEGNVERIGFVGSDNWK